MKYFKAVVNFPNIDGYIASWRSELETIRQYPELHVMSGQEIIVAVNHPCIYLAADIKIEGQRYSLSFVEFSPEEDTMKSVLQNWVMELGLRHQGVLLTAVRGCDTAPKNDVSKDLQRCLRETILNCHCGDSSKSLSFIEKVSDNELQKRMKGFADSHDEYPHHYVMHLTHASEIIGWYHPDSLTASRWNTFYRTMCRKMHMNCEGRDQLDNRLNAEEKTFGKMQENSEEK